MKWRGNTAIGCLPRPWALRQPLRRTSARQSGRGLKPQLLELLENRKPEETRLSPPAPCLARASGSGRLTRRGEARPSLWGTCLAQAVVARDNLPARSVPSERWHRPGGGAPRALVVAGVGRPR